MVTLLILNQLYKFFHWKPPQQIYSKVMPLNLKHITTLLCEVQY